MKNVFPETLFNPEKHAKVAGINNPIENVWKLVIIAILCNLLLGVCIYMFFRSIL